MSRWCDFFGSYLKVHTSDHEWPRMTTSDHEWLRITTNDHEWPRVISVFKSHKTIIKNYFKVAPYGFCIILHFCIQKSHVSSLYMTRRRNLLDTLTMLSWALQFTTFALKVRYHGDSVLWLIKLKMSFSDRFKNLKICIKDLSCLMIFFFNFKKFYGTFHRLFPLRKKDIEILFSCY
jgi:hypothetical protein